MYSIFYGFFASFVSEKYAEILSYAALLLAIAAACFLARFLIRFIVVKGIARTAKKTKTKWDDVLLEKKVFHRVSNLAIPIVMHLFSGSFPKAVPLWNKLVDALALLIMMLIADALINSIDAIYRGYEISKIKPIRGLLQVAKVVVFIIGGIVLVALLVGESPLVLLGGIGAMTAVTSLIFKDAILGFVAGVQLTSNDMVRIGDWIEMPKYSADGTVVDLSLTTVKVENFDKSITTIPAYAMVSDAFINWRGMVMSGGRRIKRAIYIDAGSVKLCDDSMIERFQKIHLLKGYMEDKLQDIEQYNSTHVFDLSLPVNGRRLTNIGTFRAYITEYLKQHPGIRKDMSMMVRQLSPSGNGIPLEVYAFANTVDWAEYEGIQSDIFDHLYSVAGSFDLTVFQNPSGSDIRAAGKGYLQGVGGIKTGDPG